MAEREIVYYVIRKVQLNIDLQHGHLFLSIPCAEQGVAQQTKAVLWI